MHQRRYGAQSEITDESSVKVIALRTSDVLRGRRGGKKTNTRRFAGEERESRVELRGPTRLSGPI